LKTISWVPPTPLTFTLCFASLTFFSIFRLTI
jgi:hypothetical protein